VIGWVGLQKNVHLFVTAMTVTVVLFGHCVCGESVDVFVAHLVLVVGLRVRQSSAAVEITLSFGLILLEVWDQFIDNVLHRAVETDVLQWM